MPLSLPCTAPCNPWVPPMGLSGYRSVTAYRTYALDDRSGLEDPVRGATTARTLSLAWLDRTEDILPSQFRMRHLHAYEVPARHTFISPAPIRYAPLRAVMQRTRKLPKIQDDKQKDDAVPVPLISEAVSNVLGSNELLVHISTFQKPAIPDIPS